MTTEEMIAYLEKYDDRISNGDFYNNIRESYSKTYFESYVKRHYDDLQDFRVRHKGDKHGMKVEAELKSKGLA